MGLSSARAKWTNIPKAGMGTWLGPHIPGWFLAGERSESCISEFFCVLGGAGYVPSGDEGGLREAISGLDA